MIFVIKCCQPSLDGEKAVQQLGIKNAALTVADHLHHLLSGEGVFVNPLAAQGIVHVRNGDYLRPGADLVPLEPIGISFAIPSFVVVAGNVPGVLVGTVFPQLGYAL